MKKYHNQVDMPNLSKMKVILKECKDKAKKNSNVNCSVTAFVSHVW